MAIPSSETVSEAVLVATPATGARADDGEGGGGSTSFVADGVCSCERVRSTLVRPKNILVNES